MFYSQFFVPNTTTTAISSIYLFKKWIFTLNFLFLIKTSLY